jgi:hypothetical protein
MFPPALLLCIRRVFTWPELCIVSGEAFPFLSDARLFEGIAPSAALRRRDPHLFLATSWYNDHRANAQDTSVLAPGSITSAFFAGPDSRKPRYVTWPHPLVAGEK